MPSASEVEKIRHKHDSCVQIEAKNWKLEASAITLNENILSFA